MGFGEVDMFQTGLDRDDIDRLDFDFGWDAAVLPLVDSAGFVRGPCDFERFAYRPFVRPVLRGAFGRWPACRMRFAMIGPMIGTERTEV